MEIWISRVGYIRLLNHKFKILEHGMDRPNTDPYHDLIKITNQEKEEQSKEFINKIYGDCIICLSEPNDMILQCGHLSH